jgi:hypothetical protein
VTTRRTLFWRSVMPRTVEESTTLAIDAERAGWDKRRGGQVEDSLPRRVGPATPSGFQPKLSAGSPG